MTSNIKNTADLRNLLLDVIDGVRKGKVDPQQAKAISGLSSQILQSARLDFNVMKMAMDTGSISAPKSVSLVTKEVKQIGRPKKVA